MTDASRQDIDRSSWNEAIRRGIADCFVEAVKGFCHHPTLQYQWLKYLPEGTIHDPFWRHLRVLILDSLKESQVLFSWSGKPCSPTSLCFVPSRYRDKNGVPLFDDLKDECYLSPKYSWNSDKNMLLDLGVRKLGWQHLLPRILPYLQGHIFQPRLLRIPFDDDWHTRVSSLLQEGLDTEYSSKIKSLPLIPLHNGELASTYDRGAIYFPQDSSGTQIPTDLDLSFVEAGALENPSLVALYFKLGVKYCNPDDIVNKIIGRYNRKDGVSLSQSVCHLRYLFRTLPENGELDNKIFVMDTHETRVYRKFVPFGVDLAVDDVYFDTGEKYGMRYLITEINKTKHISRASNYHFLHPLYLASNKPGERRHDRSWEEWLHQKAAVRYIPRLRSSSSTILAFIWLDISMTCPWMLLGALRTYWHRYPTSEKAVRSGVAMLDVMCENDEIHPLRDTYLPLEELTQIPKELFIHSQFPFVLLPADWEDNKTPTLDGWLFLTELGVGRKVDLQFYLLALQYSVRTNSEMVNSDVKGAIFKIYEGIASQATEKDYDHIR